MTAADRAREVSDYLHDLFLIPPACDEQIVNAIAAAISDAERAAVERCAAIAQEGLEREGSSGQGECDWVLRRIREARP